MCVEWEMGDGRERQIQKRVGNERETSKYAQMEGLREIERE